MTFIEVLPADRANIRVHGNGFLQAETACGGKLHIWDPRLPRQKTPNCIHNHNHGFISTVLKGVIELTEFTVTGGEQFVIHLCDPRKGKDTKLTPIDSPTAIVDLKVNRVFRMTEGSLYQFPLEMFRYHEVIPKTNVAITYVRSTERLGEEVLPSVLVPYGEEPDNDFDRYAFYEQAAKVYKEHLIQLLHKQIVTLGEF